MYSLFFLLFVTHTHLTEDSLKKEGLFWLAVSEERVILHCGQGRQREGKPWWPKPEVSRSHRVTVQKQSDKEVGPDQ